MNFKKNNLYHLAYLLPVIVMGYLLYQNSKSQLTINYNLEKNPLISELVPVDRVSEVTIEGKYRYRIIKKEPVYLDARLPRKYDSVEIEVEYMDLEAPIFEVGLAQNEARTAYKFKYLDNKILDSLDWSVIRRDDGRALYQKTPIYKSINDYYKNPSDFKNTIIYRTDIMPSINELDYKGNTVIDFPIKEKIKLVAYGDKLDLKIEAIGEYKIDKIKKGAVTVFDVVGNSETIFTKIAINSKYVAIANRIYFGELKTAENIYLAGSRILAKANTVDGIQKLQVENKYISVKDIFVRYENNFNNRNIKKVSIPYGNLEVEGAFFYLNNENIFYPGYEAFYPGLNLESVDYILANYNPPKEKEDIKTASAKFNIKNVPTPYGKLRFVFSFPEAEKDELAKIKNIKISLKGKKLGLVEIIQKSIKSIFSSIAI